MTTKTAEKAIISVGKKKTAIARARIAKGTGVIKINSKLLETWGSDVERNFIKEPLFVLGDFPKSIDIDVNVAGGGRVSQAIASRVAIARGITSYFEDEKIRHLLLSYDDKILAGDPRQREACKPNDSAPRAKRQKSYR